LPALTKETRFFDVHFDRGLDWYLRHFSTSRPEHKRRGEVAPTYFASREARERIAKTIARAKVVCVLRNPVDRVISLYRLKRSFGMIPWSLEEAVLQDPELFESGKYATHLKAWHQAFGKQQVLVTFYDDLRDRPQLYVDVLADFIGIPRFPLSPAEIRYVNTSESMTHPRHYHWTRNGTEMAEWLKSRRFHRLVAAVRNSQLRKLFLGGGAPFREASQEVVRSLYDSFRPEVEELESILNRDFTSWKGLDLRSKPITTTA
jgi:Sulfotransferase domain